MRESELRQVAFDSPFTPVICGAIPNELIESELFGHEKKGALTDAKQPPKGYFDAADGGTCFSTSSASHPPWRS